MTKTLKVSKSDAISYGAAWSVAPKKLKSQALKDGLSEKDFDDLSLALPSRGEGDDLEITGGKMQVTPSVEKAIAWVEKHYEAIFL